MNICILVRSTLTHQMGGTQVLCQTLSEVAESGHSVTIITTKHPQGVEHECKNGSSIHYLSNTRPARLNKYWWKESVNKIVELHKKNSFDVIWAQNLAGYYYAWKVKPTLKIPIISVIHGLGILGHIRSEWNCLSSFKECISFAGKYLPEAFFCYIPWLFRTLKYSDAIVGVSEQTQEALRKEFGVDEKKIFVIYDGIDMEKFKPDKEKGESIRKKLSLTENNQVLLIAGVAHKQKGMHIGLQAFAKIKKEFKNVKLMIVGEGPQLPELKKLTKKLGIEKDVIWCGFISNEDISFYYNAADIFLNPTIRVEGLSLVTVEAMACGLPSVITRIGGTQSTIDEGISGFFIKPRDASSLAEKTIKILTDSSLSKKMGRGAREKALRKFSKEKMIADYLDISEKVGKRGL
ncbi:MAG: glycosyltransferase family 4 protein [Candidatus Omnitrophota bacterium]|nr:MAG: glycosyltransferase family 4 protein [Candidatus Omnitrophota bacterium]